MRSRMSKDRVEKRIGRVYGIGNRKRGIRKEE